MSLTLPIAGEKRPLEIAIARLPMQYEWVGLVLRRLAKDLPYDRPLKVLDVGSAQGGNLIAIQQYGHQAFGVEPWEPARITAKLLAQHLETEVEIRAGTMEHIPYEDCLFDLVLAFSVVEHVESVEESFKEVYRVLRPGGIFWFSTASSVSPRQGEIRRFPLFGWYPDKIKQKIMVWARDHKPELIGYTSTPAFHWFTPKKATTLLQEAGFTNIRDRWDLRLPDESESKSEQNFLNLARRFSFIKLLGDIIVIGCAYAAQKPFIIVYGRDQIINYESY